MPDVVFALDGETRQPSLHDADGDQHRAVLQPDHPLAVGEHLFTVAFVDGIGALEARAVAFTVG